MIYTPFKSHLSFAHYRNVVPHLWNVLQYSTWGFILYIKPPCPTRVGLDVLLAQLSRIEKMYTVFFSLSVFKVTSFQVYLFLHIVVESLGNLVKRILYQGYILNCKWMWNVWLATWTTILDKCAQTLPCQMSFINKEHLTVFIMQKMSFCDNTDQLHVFAV